MTADTNTVRTSLSGADSVLPSLAGWEETIILPIERSSHNEATHRSPELSLDDPHDRRRELQNALVTAFCHTVCRFCDERRVS